MRTRQIVKTVDALQSQGRVVLTLDCGHYVTLLPYMFDNLAECQPGQPCPCQACPDPPAEKTAAQLWHEAGEP